MVGGGVEDEVAVGAQVVAHVGDGHAEARGANHLEVVGRVAEAHGLVDAHAGNPCKVAKAGALVDALGDDLQVAAGRVRDVGLVAQHGLHDVAPEVVQPREVLAHEDELGQHRHAREVLVLEGHDVLQAREVDLLDLGGVPHEDVAVGVVGVHGQAAAHAELPEALGEVVVEVVLGERLGVAVAVDEGAVVRDDVAALEQRRVHALEVVEDGAIAAARAGDEEHAQLAQAPKCPDVGGGDVVLPVEERLVHVACDQLVHASLLGAFRSLRYPQYVESITPRTRKGAVRA